MPVLLWILFIGLVAGTVARLIMPGPNKPHGFLLTIALGVAGAFLASFIGDYLGVYAPHRGAGFIGATVGAIIILFIWHRLVAWQVIPDHGV
jgi:uncharacterized membrane protein YeaQ/YmgE (transglycosylase-associated protein family)